MVLTEQQKQFFDTFGYLGFPGLLKDSVGWITEEFENVFKSRKDVVHDGSKRTMFPASFIEQNEKLCTLLDDPRIVGLLKGLLGEDFMYQGGDGNYYSGDTGWHSDLMPNCPMYKASRHVKVAFYLDPLTRDTGALRVVPGSHIRDDKFSGNLHKQINQLGIKGQDIPSVALETVPGDILVFDHNLKHASYGGSKFRRMFTMNNCAYPHTPEARAEFDAEMGWYASQGVQKFHSDKMYKDAPEERLKHLKPLQAFEPMMQRLYKESVAKKEAEAKKLQPANA